MKHHQQHPQQQQDDRYMNDRLKLRCHQCIRIELVLILKVGGKTKATTMNVNRKKEIGRDLGNDTEPTGGIGSA